MDSYLVKKIENEFASKRFRASSRKKELTEKLYFSHPRLKELEDEKRLIASDFSISKEDRKSKVTDANNRITAYLAENNLALPEEEHECSVCNDTGVNGNGYCSCFIKRLIEISLSEDTLTDPEQSFENFNDSLFDESEKEYILSVKKYCKAYSENFPKVKKPNILLSGSTGTGKTYLLSAMALKMKENGISVVYITAGRMFDILRKYALNQISDIDLLLNAEMLMIDDLGTEPVFNNITLEYTFMLINERTRLKKALCISTNLTPNELKDRYTERISSRLLDADTTNIFRFNGKDLRIRK